MFKFDPSSLRTQQVGVVHISKATVNPSIKFIDSDGVTHKHNVPTAVARTLRNSLNGVSRFIEPYPICVTFVGNNIVCAEAAVKDQLVSYHETGDWFANSECNVSLIQAEPREFWFDGQFAYFDAEAPKFFGGHANLGYQLVNAYNLYRLSNRVTIKIQQYASLGYYDHEAEQWTMTAPVVRATTDTIQLFGDIDDPSRRGGIMDVSQDDEIGRIDRYYYPNLRFVNYAAKVLAEQFHYDVIEPLGLPLLIIEHRTFNLRSIAQAMQISSRCTLSMSTAMAWLIGLNKQVKTLDDLIAIKSCIKMLLTKGVTGEMYKDDSAKQQNISRAKFITDLKHKHESAPLLSFDELNVE